MLKPRLVGITLFLALTPSCGLGARTILETPVTQRCEATGLKGCPKITDGVLLYLDGKHDEGSSKLRDGAAENEPEKLRAFADAVKKLASVPGADSYTAQLVEIASVLSPSESSPSASLAKTPSPEQLYAGTEGDPEGKEPSPPAWSKVAGLRAGTSFPDSDKKAKACTVSLNGRSTSGTCVRAAIGPLVVTDLERVGPCSRDLLVVSGGLEGPLWVLASPLNVHGAAMMVQEAEPLTVFVASGDAGDGGVVQCGVTWAGRRP